MALREHPALRDLTQPGVAREVLEAATSRLDGQRAAPDTVRKHGCCSPTRWTTPSSSNSSTRTRHRASPRASQSRGWGELHLTSGQPRPTPARRRHWTNDGALRATRALKHRIEGESRTVPIPPQLVVILREHLAEFPDGPQGRLFYGVRSESLPSTTFPQAWRHARHLALSPREQKSPLARRPCDLRHACVSTSSNAGVAAPQAAAWAGHGVDVLLKIYAKTIEGQEGIARQRIEDTLDHGLDVQDE